MTHPIKDASIYQMIFLLSWHALEDEREFIWHTEALEDFLKASWNKVNPKKAFPDQYLQKFLTKTKASLFSGDSAYDLHEDTRVLPSEGWIEVDNMSLELETRSFDDTMRIDLTYLIEGENSAEVFEKIWYEKLHTEQIKSKECGKHSFIGEMYYPVAQIVGKCDVEKAREIASDILACLGGNKEGELQVLEQRWGYLILPSEVKNKPVILYRGTQNSRLAVADLVHEDLPDLFLSLLKFDYIMGLIQKSRPKIEQWEKELNDIAIRSLSDVSGSPAGKNIQSLGKMEEAAIRLSGVQGVFINEITNLKVYLKEIELACYNLDQILERKAFGRSAPLLKEFWAKDINLAFKQIETNLDLYNYSKETADIALDSISNIALIRGTQWSRRINFLIVLLTSWGVTSLFGPDLPSWYLKLLFMFGLALLLYHLLPKFQDWLRI